MRIRTSDSDPLDFCRASKPSGRSCFPKTEEEACKKYGNLGDGPDGRGNCFTYDDEHPDYDGEGYRCHTCNKLLTSNDN